MKSPRTTQGRRVWAYTFHALEDNGDRVGCSFSDGLETGLDHWRDNPRVTWVDVHGPAGFRRLFIREDSADPASDWVAK